MIQIEEKTGIPSVTRLPSWFQQDLPDMQKIRKMQTLFRTNRLHTVCESARCPNMGKCWGQGVATFMILGEVCTRACRFCAVKAGRPQRVDPEEPQNVALAVKALGLRYVVVTSVARDDLQDEGAEQFVKTILAIRALMPQIKIEILIPDFSNKLASLEAVMRVKPQVISHNIETVRRLSPLVRPQADYERSLKVLGTIKQLDSSIFMKSSVMVGLGESHSDILEVMNDLLKAGCDILTIGQYLAPGGNLRHLKVKCFIPPEEFSEYRRLGLALGFKSVMSGPLVRSSFLAEEGYWDCIKSVHPSVRV